MTSKSIEKNTSDSMSEEEVFCTFKRATKTVFDVSLTLH
jgi:hypothetical protein